MCAVYSTKEFSFCNSARKKKEQKIVMSDNVLCAYPNNFFNKKLKKKCGKNTRKVKEKSP